MTDTTEARELARAARITTFSLRADFDLLDSVAVLCNVVDRLAAAVILLADDAESTRRLIQSRTEHLA